VSWTVVFEPARRQREALSQRQLAMQCDTRNPRGPDRGVPDLDGVFAVPGDGEVRTGSGMKR